MRKSRAIAGSAIFFVVAPMVVAGFIPWWLAGTSARFASPLALLVGIVLIVPGVAILIHAFLRFALDGAGTPAPVAPTEHLVVGGVYRFVRNPMYVSVLSIIAGQAILYGSLAVAFYGMIAAAAMIGFVKLYEEPVLADRYGEAYERYRRAVPGWLPRLTPWRSDESAGR